MIINFENSSNFARKLYKFNEKQEKIEKIALENKIPIITREVLRYMIFLAENINAKNILEIGTATGFSGIFLAEVCKKNNGKLTTIEIEKDRYLKANENFEEFGLSTYINSIHDDAMNVLPNIKEEFDFIFIDAAKSKYEDLYNYSYKLLRKGGIIFIDNIMFRGYVAEDEIPKRYKTLVRNLKEFINHLNDRYNFTLLPFGDGVGIVIK
ncbi:O-methyltransferase [Streptobacillus moniliformis]|uniref:O-methyltransferase family 3 n=1 Tax=Streptobacillus moniliformis (strain ATCC 14647 / DSM 12112 / NCTC 10651 / 9901) TaxID=519441 RepID=D1AYL3_STRM9|nr:O-methyltransferase [Streptobacillus moniliformis]ACZ01389.1 O-methyltransferase family 3 [Streptobacillus moniliformis DSM 12112]AVL43598.1 O-methyltransferase [Streptobacillus moniliformis]QXW66076.1 O-methyltransferase [Streptobacillus moniliformis]SQA13451.1 Putative O-methyltransferase MSMEG_5073 [Streptobacillus moniliformis]